MGTEAMKLRLSEKYLGTLSGLGQEKNDIILPKDITSYDAVMQGLSLEEFNEKKK